MVISDCVGTLSVRVRHQSFVVGEKNSAPRSGGYQGGLQPDLFPLSLSSCLPAGKLLAFKEVFWPEE